MYIQKKNPRSASENNLSTKGFRTEEMSELLSEVKELIHSSKECNELGDIEILNVYLFGSRAYGTASDTSDYDLIVVIDCTYFYGSKLIESKLYNINIYHKLYYEELLNQHILAPVLCIFLPTECRWQEEFKFNFELKLINLKKAALQDGSHNLAKAKRLWTIDKDIKKGKKNLVHGLRYMHYAKQLAETGSISNIQAGNNYFYEIMQIPSDNWDDYESMYKPIYQNFFHYLEHSFEPPLPTQYDNCPFTTVRYIKQFGIKSLVKELSMKIHQQDNLIYILSDRYYSPTTHPVVRECWNGLLINKNDLSIISCSLKLWFDHDDLQSDKIDLNHCLLTEKLNGHSITMYWNIDTWSISSSESMDATDDLHRSFYTKSTYQLYMNRNSISSSVLLLSDLFWKVWKEHNLKLPDDTSLCYCFELVSTEAPIIVRYQSSNIFLTGVISKMDNKELDPIEIANRYGWNLPRKVNFIRNMEDFDEMTTLMKTLLFIDPTVTEGLVAMDSNFRRMTIKLPPFKWLQSYLEENTIYWSSDKNTIERLLFEIARTTDINNLKFVEIYPELELPFKKILSRYQRCIELVKKTREDLSFVENNPQEYAKMAKKYPFYGALFELRENWSLSKLLTYFALLNSKTFFNYIRKTESLFTSK